MRHFGKLNIWLLLLAVGVYNIMKTKIKYLFKEWALYQKYWIALISHFTHILHTIQTPFISLTKTHAFSQPSHSELPGKLNINAIIHFIHTFSYFLPQTHTNTDSKKKTTVTSTPHNKKKKQKWNLNSKIKNWTCQLELSFFFLINKASVKNSVGAWIMQGAHMLIVDRRKRYLDPHSRAIFVALFLAQLK